MTGAYGGYVVQLTKTEGLTVIAEADETLVKSLAADTVVRQGADVTARFRRHIRMTLMA